MHGQPFTMYCNENQCKILVCPTCCILKHGGHKVVDVQEKGKEIRDKFDKNREKYASARETLNEKIEKVDDAREKILNNSAKVQKELETFKAHLMYEIENGIQDLKAYAEKNAMAELAKIDYASATLRDKVTTLNDTEAAKKQVIDDGNVYNVIDKMDALGLDDDPAKLMVDIANDYKTMSFNPPTQKADFRANVLGGIQHKMRKINGPDPVCQNVPITYIGTVGSKWVFTKN